MKICLPTERHLKFEFLGNLLTVNKITIQNKMGRQLMDNLLKNKEYLKVSEKYESINGNNITSNTNKVQDTQFQIALSKRLPDEKMYAVISGKDHRGYDFHRMALVKRVYDNDVFPQPPLTVALGLSSALIVQPNKFSDIYFEVTNRGNKAAQVYFSIKGEKHILYAMTPYRKIMSPDETTSVRVTIAPGPGTYQDRLTFQAGGGAVSVEKSVIVDVGTDIVDTESPDISHTYLSDCTANWGSCQDNVWTIEIKAKDSESGLLQVISNPKGIFFRNEFTSGTKEEVTGYYSGTCCRPEILITAVDRKENAYTKKYNAFHALWGPGAIAGLILGVLFILLLIAIIIIALHKWQKKRTVSYDLPVYRSKLRERY